MFSLPQETSRQCCYGRCQRHFCLGPLVRSVMLSGLTLTQSSFNWFLCMVKKMVQVHPSARCCADFPEPFVFLSPPEYSFLLCGRLVGCTVVGLFLGVLFCPIHLCVCVRACVRACVCVFWARTKYFKYFSLVLYPEIWYWDASCFYINIY